jgi:hypothetical protein
MAACSIVSHAFLEVPFSSVSALRDSPAPEGAPALPPRFLRHCDEQAVVAMHAVLRAIAAHPARQASFAGYGVVAASCQAGQIQAAKVLADFGIGGAVRVSPHIVPQCSLHSIAGAVSVALGMHGPNIGVGGGPDALEEGLVAAVTLLHEPAGSDHTGVFLVASEWDPEPTLSHAGTLVDDPLCRAFAVALEPETAAGLTLALEFSPAALPGAAREDSADDGRDRLRSFARALSMCARGGALVSWGLPCSWGIRARVSGAAGAPAVAAEHSHCLPRKAA